MARPLAFLLSFLFLASAHALCVQTFNAYGAFYAGATAARTAQFSKVLASDSCDLIQLQEVFAGSAANMPNLIESALGSAYTVHSPTRESNNGLMTFTKASLSERNFYRFAAQTLFGIRKGFSTARARFPGLAEDVLLVNLHLHHTSAASRLSQLMELIAWRYAHPEPTMILAGDFNADPASLERRLVTTLLRLKDSVVEVHGKYPVGFCTYCKENHRSWDGFPFGRGGDHVYDYVSISRGTTAGLDFKVRDVTVNLKGHPKFTLSDHYGLRVDLDAVPVVAPTQVESRAQVQAALLEAAFTLKELAKMRSSEATRAATALLEIYRQLDKGNGSAYAYLSR